MIIKRNRNIELKHPRFTVDGAINVELKSYDALESLNRASACAFVGTSGSGKTSLLHSFLTNRKPNIWRKQFENIIVVMPRASRASLKNNIFDKYLPENYLYDSLTEEVVDEITSLIEINSEKKERTLLILDDVASALKNGYVAKKLQHLVYAYRHFLLNIVFLVQTLKTIPLPIRKNLSCIIVFHKPRIADWEAISHEFLEMDQEDSKKLFRLIFQEKYDWGLINLTSGRVFRKFDEILYKDS